VSARIDENGVKMEKLWQTMVVCGCGASASKRCGGKGKSGRGSSPQGRTPAVARSNNGAARRRPQRRSRSGGEGGGAAGFPETRGGGCGSYGS
jgi:hypothetical protein